MISYLLYVIGTHDVELFKVSTHNVHMPNIETSVVYIFKKSSGLTKYLSRTLHNYNCKKCVKRNLSRKRSDHTRPTSYQGINVFFQWNRRLHCGSSPESYSDFFLYKGSFWSSDPKVDYPQPLSIGIVKILCLFPLLSR